MVSTPDVTAPPGDWSHGNSCPLSTRDRRSANACLNSELRPDIRS